MAPDRRSLLRGAVVGGGMLSLQGLMPAWTQTGSLGLRADFPSLTGAKRRGHVEVGIRALF